jgi:hypothetical protein
VFDLRERPLVVTEHQASIYRCAHCRGDTKPAFPVGVVFAHSIWRAHQGRGDLSQYPTTLMPEDRTAQALSDLFGAPLICPASILAWVRKKGEDLRLVYARIGERLAKVRLGSGRNHHFEHSTTPISAPVYLLPFRAAVSFGSIDRVPYHTAKKALTGIAVKQRARERPEAMRPSA